MVTILPVVDSVENTSEVVEEYSAHGPEEKHVGPMSQPKEKLQLACIAWDGICRVWRSQVGHLRILGRWKVHRSSLPRAEPCSDCATVGVLVESRKRLSSASHGCKQCATTLTTLGRRRIGRSASEVGPAWYDCCCPESSLWGSRWLQASHIGNRQLHRLELRSFLIPVSRHCCVEY